MAMSSSTYTGGPGGHRGAAEMLLWHFVLLHGMYSMTGRYKHPSKPFCADRVETQTLSYLQRYRRELTKSTWSPQQSTVHGDLTGMIGSVRDHNTVLAAVKQQTRLKAAQAMGRAAAVVKLKRTLASPIVKLKVRSTAYGALLTRVLGGPSVVGRRAAAC